MAFTGNTTLPPETVTLTCDSDLSAKDGYAVNLDTADDENVDLAADETKFPFPLVEGEDGSAEKTVVTVAVGGSANVVLGASVNAGDKLTSDASGKWIPTTNSGELYGAIALHGGVANDVIAVLVRQGADNSAY